MIRIVSFPDDLKDIRNSDNLYRFDLRGDEFPFNAFDYYVDMKIVAYGTGEDRTILKDNKEYLQQRIDKAIEYINKEEKIYEINKSSTQLGCIDFIVNTNDFKNRIKKKKKK